MRTSGILLGLTLAALTGVIAFRVSRGPAAGAANVSSHDWPLGAPDLVVRVEGPLTFEPDDQDAFRNLVLPTGLTERRFVRAVDIQPGDPSVVHHAVVKLDASGDARRRAAEDPGHGFGGMDMGLSAPPQGHFLVWTPGMEPSEEPAGRTWALEAGTDLVLQLHLPARDSTATLTPAIALYFSPEAPTEILEQVFLNSTRIDIPPGDTNYVVVDRFDVPVDVEVLSAFPHAHYLARTMHIWATRPDGSTDSLLTIDDWQFGRQLEYRFPQPQALPAGSRITMQYRYDNSAGNPANPQQPPRRVRMGMESTDEMASLRLQVRLRSDLDRLRLTEAQARHTMEESPDHPELNYELGTSLLNQGRVDEALPYLVRATEQRPAFPWAWNNLGVAQAQAGDLAAAMASWQRVVDLEPGHVEVQINLGSAALELDDPARAVDHFRKALARNPSNAPVHRSLAIALTRAGDPDGAIAALEEAIRLAPDQAGWQVELDSLRRRAAR